jgi:hypothetical protein
MALPMSNGSAYVKWQCQTQMTVPNPDDKPNNNHKITIL